MQSSLSSTAAIASGAAAANLPAQIAARAQAGRVSSFWVWAMLPARTILFLAVGLLMAGAFALGGHASPWAAAVRWWPYQVIAANLLTFGLLRWLARREGITLMDLIGFEWAKLGRDLLLSLGLLLLALVVGMAGLFGLSLLIFGTPPPDTMFQPLPLWAAWLALLLFPLTNSLVELTAYMGYALPRLGVILRRQWPAVALAALWLSLQHVAFPLIFAPDWMLWRAFAFLPLGLVVGIVYVYLRRLPPLLIVHFVMDLQIALSVLMASLA